MKWTGYRRATWVSFNRCNDLLAIDEYLQKKHLSELPQVLSRNAERKLRSAVRGAAPDRQLLVDEGPQSSIRAATPGRIITREASVASEASGENGVRKNERF